MEALSVTVACMPGAPRWMLHESQLRNFEEDTAETWSEDFTRELRVIKASLLFADQVEIASLAIAPYLRFLPSNLIEGGSQQLSSLAEDLTMKYAEALDHMANPGRGVPKGFIDTLLNEMYRTRQEAVRMFWLSNAVSALSQLRPAISEGLCRLSRFARETDADTWAAYVELVQSIARTGSSTLLLDPAALGAMPTVATPQNRPREITVKAVALSQELMLRVPNLDRASISEVIDIRNEIRPFAIRFTGKLLEFANDMTSQPWTSEFADEAILTYRRHVAPALADIDDHLRSDNSLGRFLKALNTANPGSTLIGVGLAAGAVASSAAIQALGFGSAAACAGYNLLKENAKGKVERESNSMYLYHRAMKLGEAIA